MVAGRNWNNNMGNCKNFIEIKQDSEKSVVLFKLLQGFCVIKQVIV